MIFWLSIIIGVIIVLSIFEYGQSKIKKQYLKDVEEWKNSNQDITFVGFDKKEIETDLDLPPAKRTEANMWQKKFHEASKELRNANKGIRRINKRLEKYKSEVSDLKQRLGIPGSSLPNGFTHPGPED